MKTSICLCLTIITFACVAVAQDKKNKVEVGVQTTLLTFSDPEFPGRETNAGLGGRVTYNINRSIAAEAEINFFRQVGSTFISDSNAFQAQFGVKLGKRFDKFGVFAKVRPGFLSIDRVLSVQPDPEGSTEIGDLFRIERTNFFTIDTGAVLELYLSKRPIVRFEAGDTLVRHRAQYDFAFTTPLSVQLIRPAKFTHNFQFTAGIGFRLGDFPPGEDDVKTSADTRERTPRFEVGAQFTMMYVFPASNAAPCPACLTSDRLLTQPGFGGRFTFNLTNNIALEAEGNFFTREIDSLPNPSGHIFQGQFGAKIGKRFEKWGGFGKVRPGFVGFTQVNELIGTHFQLNNLVIPAIVGEFGVGKTIYPSIDLGGVVEFYISRRWLARFDVGDTIIRYGELPVATFSARFPIFRRPPETHHNLQLTSGVGFRF